MASLRSPHSQVLNRIKPSAFPSSKRTLLSLSTHHHRLPTHTNELYSRNSFSCITSPSTSFLNRFFSSTPRNPAMAAAAKTKVQGLIDQYPIGTMTAEEFPLLSPYGLCKAQTQTQLLTGYLVVFSKTYCPYCKATKSLLAEKVKDKSKLHIIELDNECK